MSPFETKIKTDITNFEHSDFWWFDVILAVLGILWVDLSPILGLIPGRGTRYAGYRVPRGTRFQQLAKRLCPSELSRDSMQGGTVGLKSYCTVVEIHRAGTKQVL